MQAEPSGRFVDYCLGDAKVGELLRLAEKLLGGVACGVKACRLYEDDQR